MASRALLRRRVWPLILAAVLSLGAAGAARAHDPGEAPAASPNLFHLTILHTNDIHGHILPEVDKHVAPAPAKVGGAAYVAAYIERERAEHPRRTLLIDAGDIAQGTPVSNLFRGKPVVESMNLMRYDAGTIGNHGFDWGPAALSNMVRWAHHPVVCANLLVKATGQAPTGVRLFVLKKVAGVTVGITGLTLPSTPSISFHKNVASFTFVPAADAMRKVLPQMRAAGAQVILVASHLGDDGDCALAEAVPGIDVIVGGHTHKALFSPLFVNGTVILQAGKYMRYLGDLDVTIDRRTWKVVDFTRKDELIPILDDKIQPDASVAGVVKKYQDQLAPAMDQVLGRAGADLTPSAGSGCTDSVLGDLITDALRWRTGADVAVYNAGGIRSVINRGPIKLGDVYTLLPFDNFVVTMDLSGQQLLTLLAQGIRNPEGTIQVSGLTFAIDAQGKPARVEVNGQALEPTKTYHVSTVDFLAEGNDGLKILRDGTHRRYDELSRDVFSAFVREKSPLLAPVTGRIKRTAVN